MSIIDLIVGPKIFFPMISYTQLLGVVPVAINFNEPYVTGNELKYIKKVFESSHFQGNGPFTKIAHDLLSSRFGGSEIFGRHIGEEEGVARRRSGEDCL